MNTKSPCTLAVTTLVLLLALLLGACSASSPSQPVRIAALLSGDIRLETLDGLQDGLQELGYVPDETIVFEVFSAQGDRNELANLAREIVDSEPDLAVAAGGIEADALLVATEGTDLPVVFLSVSSTLDRGLVASIRSSGNNLTGIDTNDTSLTAKRLEWLHAILPQAQHVWILNVPSITPCVKSAAIAAETAPGLGLQTTIVDVETQADIQAAVEGMPADVDALLILPGAPIWEALKPTLYPAAMERGIPIFGVNRQDIERGAVASYASSRYRNGMQAARIVDRVLQGTPPSELPIETPDTLELVINRWIVDRLALDLPDSVWDQAQDVVNEPISP